MSRNPMISFDPTDWNSIYEVFTAILKIGTMQFGETAEKETIIFSAVSDDDGDRLVTEVQQNNGWVRKNIYWLDDGTVEELYKKEQVN